jgi:glycerol-3-phosphate acyltransferase PlsY
VSDVVALAIALVIGAYLLGSIPFGLIVGRRRGVDVRQVGSGNIGATNVARSLGKKLGLLVLVLDVAKGALPVLALRWLELDARVHPFLLTAVGLAPMLGHCFPVWLRLHGGKGVATALGVFLALAPAVAGMAVALFAVLYALFRVVSLGSMSASMAVPALLWALGRPAPEVALGVVSAAVILIQHRQNIRRLLRRAELGV